MTKLKTLKELEKCKPVIEEDESRIEAVMNISFDKYDNKWVDITQLQDAAREWVKIFKDDLNRWFRRVENAKNDTDRNDYMTQCDILIDKMQWIEYFFNLEDEE